MAKQQRIKPGQYRTEAQKARKESQTAKLKAQMEDELARVGLLESAVVEHVFHPTRKWKIDYCWPGHKVALELQGGVFVKGPGAHTQGSRYVEDREKVAEAQLHGWALIEATPPTVRNGKAASWVQRAIQARTHNTEGAAS